jgi:cardiolipin synthase
MITTPYFVPDEPTLTALCIAAGKGIAVDLVVPERSNHRVVQLAGEAAYDALLAAGVRIHLHRGHLLHAKTLTVDDSIALLGSGNLDVRSFSLNFELSVLLYGRGVTMELRDIQEWFAAQSVLLDKAHWARRGRLRRAGAAVASLMGPVL